MKKIFSAVLAAALVLSLAACKAETKNTENAEESKPISVSLEFPSGADERTEYNKEILDINKFELTLSLPEGWTVGDKASSDFSLITAWSVRGIYDETYAETDNCIGAVGYNVIPELSDEEMEIPAAVYSQIALGNDYQFTVRERYDIVRSGDDRETALTDVYRSKVLDGEAERLNKGILMLDRSAGVYVAVELDASVTDEQHRQIAESMEITVSEKTDITDAEIKKLIEEHNFITLYTEYESLDFDQNDKTQWQGHEYYKVSDERFDEWDEWVEYVRTVYVENSENEEYILTKSHYISFDGLNFTDGGAKGCNMLFDQYTFERTAPIDGRPACKVKIPDAYEGSEGNFYVETITFENTDDGWRIYDCVRDYEDNKN